MHLSELRQSPGPRCEISVHQAVHPDQAEREGAQEVGQLGSLREESLAVRVEAVEQNPPSQAAEVVEPQAHAESRCVSKGLPHA